MNKYFIELIVLDYFFQSIIIIHFDTQTSSNFGFFIPFSSFFHPFPHDLTLDRLMDDDAKPLTVVAVDGRMANENMT